MFRFQIVKEIQTAFESSHDVEFGGLESFTHFYAFVIFIYKILDVCCLLSVSLSVLFAFLPSLVFFQSPTVARLS